MIQRQQIPEIKRLQKSVPPRLQNWKETPALPQKLFKTLTLLRKSESKIEFHTSGTTTGESGVHRMRSSDIYEGVTQAGCPWKDQAPLTILSLHPTRKSAPHSSLSFMLDHWIYTFGSPQSDHYVKDSKVDSRKLWDDLQKLIQHKSRTHPLLIAGTAFSFVHLFDDWGKSKKVQLPPDAIIMETGGYKGRSRELPKKELYRMIQKHFGVQDSQIWNEYGMTELSSQAYAQGLHGLHQTPPWAKVLLIDPQTGKEVPIGKQGLIRWLDLANVDSSVGIQTLDFGIREKNGFRLLGRAPQTDRRGCSLVIDQ
jgi:hypothetical protein